MAVPDVEKFYPRLVGAFDAVIALNVVEHIDDYELALSGKRFGLSVIAVGGRLR